MAGTVLGVQQLRDIIPVRPGMHLLDRVFIESDTKAWGLKSISMNETFFLGHFPGHPIFPGVLQVEASAQLAEVLTWKKLDPERKGDFYVKEIHQVKFRKPNYPGDRMMIELEITAVNSDSAEFTATIRNSSGVASNVKGTVAVRSKVEPEDWAKEFNEFDRGSNLAKDPAAIQSIIPHRFPFLLVDYVATINGGHVVGVKNATETEPLFRQYNDGYTVLLGSVQPEITAQVGAIYSLSLDACKGKIAYFMGIDTAEFITPVFPGDQLRLEVDMPDFKSKFGRGEGQMIVNGKVASRTVMMFAIVDPI